MSRYYRTPFKEAKNSINDFLDQFTQEFLNKLYALAEEFAASFGDQGQQNSFKSAFGNWFQSLSPDFNKSQITKEWLAEQYYLMQKYKSGYRSMAWKFIFFTIISHEFYSTEELSWFKDRLATIDNIQNSGKLIVPILESEKSVYHFALISHHALRYSNIEEVSLLEFDTDSSVMQNLLLDFMKLHFKPFPRIYHLSFFREFGKSLNGISIDSVDDFNITTLKKQSEYFHNYHADTTYSLRMFYTYILDLQGESTSITLRDGVNKEFILMSSFVKLFLEGYRVVPVSIYEHYPSFDKWLTMPNGSEKRTATEKPNKYYPIDFSRVSDNALKNACKKWYWEHDTVALSNRQRQIVYIMEFIEHRDKMRELHMAELVSKRSRIDVTGKIIAEEVISYVMNWRNKVTANSYMKRISPLKLFLKQLASEETYYVEPACFEYLSVRKFNLPPFSSADIKTIPPDEFKKLVTQLEQSATLSDLYKLYYIVFCLVTLTPLRLASVLDLDINCVVEKGRKGIYALRTLSKSSYGDTKDIQISDHTKRLIEVAISITKSSRRSANDDVRHFLFLVKYKGNNYHAMPSQSFNAFIERQCKLIGIPSYSSNNLRKTYMTTIVENAIKNNVSLMNLKALTGHKSFDTTDNYYVKNNIRNYLEATCGIEIGNAPINGSIVNEYDDNHGNENVVADKTGYCRNADCDIPGTATCLMCDGFVTTPSHKNYFYEALSNLDRRIFSTSNEHDKEHLYAVKQLYVAYLEQIFITERGLTDEQ